MSQFKKGDRVVCLDQPGFDPGPDVPVFGRIYTVRDTFFNEDEILHIEELRECPSGRYVGWFSYRFVPINQIQ